MKSVVIADDEPIMRYDITLILQDMGFSVIGEAADGFDAVSQCNISKPDIALLDVRMPIFDGIVAAEKIIEENLAGCVILLTAYYDEALIERAAQIGVTGYLVKPVDASKLLPTIEVAYAQGQRLRKLNQEVSNSRLRLEESRVIDHAKSLLAMEHGITELKAYQELQRLAMDKRSTVFSLAEAIVQRYSRRVVVNRAKEYLIKLESISEQAAYKRVRDLAKDRGISLEDAAKQILSER